MLQRAIAFALTLTTAGIAAHGQSSWLRTDSRHFEIHARPAVADEVGRVTRSAERAYGRISGRLNFTLATRVPLVMYAPSGPAAREDVVAYAASEQVAPHHPHRSRIVLPLPDADAELDALIVHELTHLLFSEIILPGRGGDGGVPRWVHEGIAGYMVGAWPADDERLMRELAAARGIPALSHLAGGGGFANPRVHDALGHAAFDYVEHRWGPAGIRRFVDALIVPRVDKTYDAVFDLTPAEFDTAFRQYAERRFAR